MSGYGPNAIQTGDVLLICTEEGFDMVIEDGIVETTEGPETMGKLSLVGGNQDDDGSEATEKKQWWGNEGEPKERKLRSRFHSLLNGTPMTSATVKDLGGAAMEQLEADFIDGGYAEAVGADVSLSTPKRVDVEAPITLFSGDIVPVTISEKL
jgi:hypothetical protein